MVLPAISGFVMLQERLAKLVGGVAVIKAGAAGAPFNHVLCD
jgi:hypothetical protein